MLTERESIERLLFESLHNQEFKCLHMYVCKEIIRLYHYLEILYIQTYIHMYAYIYVGTIDLYHIYELQNINLFLCIHNVSCAKTNL